MAHICQRTVQIELIHFIYCYFFLLCLEMINLFMYTPLEIYTVKILCLKLVFICLSCSVCENALPQYFYVYPIRNIYCENSLPQTCVYQFRDISYVFLSFVNTFLLKTPLEGPLWKQSHTDLLVLSLPF